jgi:dienelactone hydrolase
MLLFHHAQGLTPGCLAFADALRADGHTVHTPDLYDRKTFATLAEGMAYADELGLHSILERGRQAADELPEETVYAGFSLGVMPAQMLAQTRPSARGAVLLHACVPPFEFGGPWPRGVALQIHTMEGDEHGDVDVARELAEAEFFLYPGDRHLFTDSSLPEYDEEAAALVLRRVSGFLSRF